MMIALHNEVLLVLTRHFQLAVAAIVIGAALVKLRREIPFKRFH